MPDDEKKGKDKEEKQPAGGYDSTPLKATSGPTYTVKITFHSATNLPVSDYGAWSSDPYINATLHTSLPTRHKTDPELQWRSETKHKTLDPVWNADWIVAGIPASGFSLKGKMYDEDEGDTDDKIGHFHFDSGEIKEGWKSPEQEYKVHKKGADLFAYTLRWGRKLLCSDVDLHARVTLSAEVIGKTDEEMGKAYTLNQFWWIHYSPMTGYLVGTKSDDDKGVKRYDFQANQLQFKGPVPNELYHRYVEFKPFVGIMFNGKGVRGFLLHRLLSSQHESIYNFSPQTKYGTFTDGPNQDVTRKFLEMVHYDEGGRIFTFVITLDGLFRFTETGKEFGIDLLSKHTMHSKVNIYIAWSGEFLVRRLSKPRRKASAPDQHTHPSEDIPGGPPNEAPPKDPRYYELIIDNDSGTYRPNGDLIPVLKKFLKKQFPGLHIVVKKCDDETLSKIKDEQRKIKKEEGTGMVYGQASDSGSISSSDEEELEERARGDAVTTGKEKGFAALENPKQAIKTAIGAT